MNKYLFVFTLLASSSAFGQSQYLCVSGGLAANNIIGDGLFEDTKSITGLQIGVSYQTVTKKKWQYCAQIQYVKRGFIEEHTSRLIEQPDTAGFLVTNRYSFSYISMPLTIGYSFKQLNCWSLNFGVIPSLLIDANAKSEFLEFDVDRDFTSEFNNFDLGGFLEINWTKSVSEFLSVNTGLRYHRSFTNLITESSWPSNKMKHVAMGLQLGLSYKLQK